MSVTLPEVDRNSRIPNIFYHGTSVESAFGIQTYGFNTGRAGGPSVALLGPGVYCTTVLEKALDYSKSLQCGGVVLMLKCDLGKCKLLLTGDAMMKTWQQNGFDSAFAPSGANFRNLAENCIKDPKRVQLLRVLAGNTAKLQCMGVCVNDSGRLAMISQKVSIPSPVSECGKRKHLALSVDEDFLTLLETWKLDSVASVLAYEGISDAAVLVNELDINDIEKIKIGIVFKARLRSLVMHLVVETQQNAVHCLSAKRMAATLAEAGQDMRILNDVFDEMSVMSSSATGQRTICKSGLVPAIMSVFKMKGVTTNVVQLASSILNCLIADGNVHAVVDSGTVVALVGAMRIQGDCINVLNCCLDVLRTIILQDRYRTHALEQIVMEDGVDTLVAIMAQYPGDWNANRISFTLLHAITKHSTIFLDKVVGKAMALLLAVQTTHWKHGPMALVGMQAFLEIIKSNTLHRDSMIEVGGIAAVFECMASNLADAALVSKCCSVLDVLSESIEMFATGTFQCDGVKSFVSVLREFGKNLLYPELIFNCCVALKRACSSLEVRSAVFSSGSVRLIVDLLILYKSDAQIQLSGIALLRVLSKCQKNLFEVAVVGGIDIILQSMELHTANVKLLIEGSNALQAIAIQHTNNVDAILAKKGFATLMKAIQTHPSAKYLYEQVMCAVGILTREHKDQNSCTEFVGTVVRSVQFHAKTVDRVESGLYALTNIVTKHHLNTRAAIDAGLIPCTTKLMRRYSDKVIVCRRSYQLLRCLVQTEEHTMSFLEAGGNEYILYALQNFTAENLLFFTIFFANIIATGGSAFHSIGHAVLPLLHSIVDGHETSAEPVHHNTRTLIALFAGITYSV
jgi:hypothetical protein